MKQWHSLLEYIDYYIYDPEDEKIIVKQSARSTNALDVYQRSLIYTLH